MDTSSFDKQAQSHLSFYHGFMNGVKIVVVLIILTLVGMAITLLWAGDRQQKGGRNAALFAALFTIAQPAISLPEKKKAISTAAVSGASEP